eukprot:jgi/Mesen1/9126/ME000058S08620
MAQSRGRDQLLGFVKVPLESLVQKRSSKQKRAVEYRLVSSYVEAPAGTLTLTLTYHHRQANRGATAVVAPVGASAEALGRSPECSPSAPCGDLVLRMGAATKDHHQQRPGPAGGGRARVREGEEEGAPPHLHFGLGLAGHGQAGTTHDGMRPSQCERASSATEPGVQQQQQPGDGCRRSVAEEEEEGGNDGDGPRGCRLMQLLPTATCRDSHAAAAAAAASASAGAGSGGGGGEAGGGGGKPASAFKPYGCDHLFKRPLCTSLCAAGGGTGAAAAGLPEEDASLRLTVGGAAGAAAGAAVCDAPLPPAKRAKVSSDLALASPRAPCGESSALVSAGPEPLLAPPPPPPLSPAAASASPGAGHRDSRGGAAAAAASPRWLASSTSSASAVAAAAAVATTGAAAAATGTSGSSQAGGGGGASVSAPPQGAVEARSLFLAARSCGEGKAKLGEDQFTPTSVLQQQASEGNRWMLMLVCCRVGRCPAANRVGGPSQASPAAGPPSWLQSGSTTFCSSRPPDAAHPPPPPAPPLPLPLPLPTTRTFLQGGGGGAGAYASSPSSVNVSACLLPSPRDRMPAAAAAVAAAGAVEHAGAPRGGSPPALSMSAHPSSSALLHSQGAVTGSPGAPCGSLHTMHMSASSLFVDSGPPHASAAGMGPGRGLISSSEEGEGEREDSSKGDQLSRDSRLVVPRLFGMPGGSTSGGRAGTGGSDWDQMSSKSTEGGSSALQQQAALIWHASQAMLHDTQTPDSSLAAAAAATARLRQREAAMWQASMGMTRDQAEKTWEQEVAAGVVTRAQVEEFSRHWHYRSRSTSHSLQSLVSLEARGVGEADREDLRRQSWQQFWEKLEAQRSQNNSQSGKGPVRYGCRAFF